MFSVFMELFKMSFENFELQHYFSTNYTEGCPSTPYFESFEFFKLISNILSAPLIVLGVYGMVVIVMATPKELKTAKWVVLKFQIASFWFGSLACFLERPFIHYPSTARYDTGLFLLLGVNFRVASLLGQTSYSIRGISQVLLFENRYNQTYTQRKMSTKLRIGFYILHYSLFLFLFINHIYTPVDDLSAKLDILDYLPCPESTFFDGKTHILTTNLSSEWILSMFQSTYLFGLAYFFAFLSAYNLLKVQQGVSEKTRKIQGNFLTCLIFQTLVPFGVLYVPNLAYYLQKDIDASYRVVGSLTGVFISCHSILASLLLIVLHKEYREFTLKFFCKKKLKESEEMTRRISVAPWTAR